MSLRDCPPENNEPTGYCVRLVNLLGEKERCEEIEYFFGPHACRDADDYFKDCLDNENYGDIDDLEPGKYRLSVHMAWKGSDTEPNDWDDEALEKVTFILTRVVNLKFLE